MKLWKIILGFLGGVGALLAVNKAKSEEVKKLKGKNFQEKFNKELIKQREKLGLR